MIVASLQTQASGEIGVSEAFLLTPKLLSSSPHPAGERLPSCFVSPMLSEHPTFRHRDFSPGRSKIFPTPLPPSC
jgi:hypothetical protein